MDFLQELINKLLPVLGQMGVDELTAQLEQLVAEAKEPWKKSVLTMVADAVATYGPEGLDMAIKLINDLMDGKSVDLDFTDLEVSSDILAKMQNAPCN